MDGRASRRPSLEGLRFEAVAKPGGGLRWLTRLDPAGEAAYRDAVRSLAGRIEHSLGPEVIASRTRPAPNGWRLAPWRPARAAWDRALRSARRASPRGTVFVVADVRDCYRSITPGTIANVVGPAAAHAVSLLHGFRDAGVRGLPVGPEPSAVLANAVLARLDEAVRVAGAHHLRWVDDFVLWGTRAEVAAALVTLHRASASLGLALHDEKTRRLEDRDEVGSAPHIRDSSIIAAP